MGESRNRPLKYIYGPVPSWRLGRSLGIDPLSQTAKVCTYDCSYCQIGKTFVFSSERKVFVPTKDILQELETIPSVEVDYYTLAGKGDPTLALNIGEIISAIKSRPGRKTAVLTNSSLLGRADVRKDLAEADLVSVKLDAPSPKIFAMINRPMGEIDFLSMLNGIRSFRKSFKGRMSLQIMFVEANAGVAEELARMAKEIGPDEIEINTPLRPCAEKAVSKERLENISRAFAGLKTVTVYDAKRPKVKPFSVADTLARRGQA